MSTPTFNEEYQFLVDTEERYSAVNEDDTLYTVLKNLDGCTYKRGKPGHEASHKPCRSIPSAANLIIRKTPSNKQIEKLHGTGPGGTEKDIDKKRKIKDKRRGTNESANLLNTQISQKDDAAGKAKEDGRRYKGRLKNAHCLFENYFGHDSGFCKNQKIAFDDKISPAKKNGTCLLCLKVAGHAIKDCSSKIKECLICKQPHHVNLHARGEVIEAFKKLKEARKT